MSDRPPHTNGISRHPPPVCIIVKIPSRIGRGPLGARPRFPCRIGNRSAISAHNASVSRGVSGTAIMVSVVVAGGV